MFLFKMLGFDCVVVVGLVDFRFLWWFHILSILLGFGLLLW
jgi:hypothetical protein